MHTNTPLPTWDPGLSDPGTGMRVRVRGSPLVYVSTLYKAQVCAVLYKAWFVELAANLARLATGKWGTS